MAAFRRDVPNIVNQPDECCDSEETPSYQSYQPDSLFQRQQNEYQQPINPLTLLSHPSHVYHQPPSSAITSPSSFSYPDYEYDEQISPYPTTNFSINTSPPPTTTTKNINLNTTPTAATSKSQKFVWTDASTELLINLWEGKEVLFNVRHPDYHKRDRKEAATKEIMQVLNEEGYDVQVSDINAKFIC